MATEHSGSRSMDPDATPTGQPQRYDNGQDEHDSRHVQRVVDRNAQLRNDRSPTDRSPNDRLSNDRDDWEQRRREPAVADHASVTAAQKEEYGGIKIGSAFFGWLTATGMAVLLTALVAAIGTGVGVVSNTDITKATNTATSNSSTVGVVGAIVLLVILLISYYCGGYVAGRMARFNGIRQGIAVWVWAVVIAAALAILAAVAGEKYNILATLNAFPRIPVHEGTLSTTGIIALVVVAVAALIGAILGGLAGMHYHRTVDETNVESATR